jgi:hypothetical protein
LYKKKKEKLKIKQYQKKLSTNRVPLMSVSAILERFELNESLFTDLGDLCMRTAFAKGAANVTYQLTQLKYNYYSIKKKNKQKTIFNLDKKKM